MYPFLKVSSLDKTIHRNLEEKPVLMYSIAYDYGPILQLDFCPSGGYAIEQQRLGLLAVTSIIGDINILSLPMRLDQGIIIKLEPSMVLKIDSDNTNNGYTTRVCWSQVVLIFLVVL